MSPPSDAHVLVVSTTHDLTTDAVVRVLAGRGVRCTRLNAEDFPFEAGMSDAIGLDGGARLRVPGRDETVFADVTSVWYRRVRAPTPPDGMERGVYEFCAREARSALLGLLLVHPARVMSPPDRIWVAEHKLVQLHLAQRLGLAVPPTVVTNDPAEVSRAFDSFGGAMAAKALRMGFVEDADAQRAIYTSRVLREHLEEVGSAKWSPAIYQRIVPKKVDVRVTVVGGHLFVAEIDVLEKGNLDWRAAPSKDLRHTRGTIPSGVADALVALVEQLGLRFGAIDLIRTPSDEYVFLEINPSGQWLWLDDALGLGITESVANWLAGAGR